MWGPKAPGPPWKEGSHLKCIKFPTCPSSWLPPAQIKVGTYGHLYTSMEAASMHCISEQTQLIWSESAGT